VALDAAAAKIVRGRSADPARLIVGVLRQIAGHFFPLLAGDAKDPV
jgi:hypothetical protein